MPSSSSVRQSSESVRQLLARQICFPSFSRTVTEALLFSIVFLAAGHVSLGFGIREMLAPMVPVVLIMMLAMVLSGVYRREITHSILTMYLHSLYGFALASVLFLLTVFWLAPEFANLKFVFFFLFSTFFVINTVRPLISGTDFRDGGGRRTN